MNQVFYAVGFLFTLTALGWVFCWWAEFFFHIREKLNDDRPCTREQQIEYANRHCGEDAEEFEIL